MLVLKRRADGIGNLIGERLEAQQELGAVCAETRVLENVAVARITFRARRRRLIATPPSRGCCRATLDRRLWRYTPPYLLTT